MNYHLPRAITSLVMLAMFTALLCPAQGSRGNLRGSVTDPVYQQLRQIYENEEAFTGSYAVVSDLVLSRDAATFVLRAGEIYFTPVTQGRVTGAVFFGSGEMILVPPTGIEKRSLQLFTEQPGITEPFTQMVLRFTDDTFDEVRRSPQATMGTQGGQAGRAHALYRDNQDLLKNRLHDNRDLRTLADLYSRSRPGFFNAFIAGKHYSKLVFLLDPLGIAEVSPEEVALLSYGDTDAGFWTSFHLAEEYKSTRASSAEDHRLIDMLHHEIVGSINGTHIDASDRITFRSLASGTRVIPLDLYPALRVSQVTDEQGNQLNFVQEDKNEDADFGIVLPEELERGKTYTVTVRYGGGDALRDSGGGNFILIPRSNWYPNNSGTQFGDRAIFDITFRYPKTMTFVGTGSRVSTELRDGATSIDKWTSGSTELAVAGFNYGKFKKRAVSDEESGYEIEFFANDKIPDELKGVQLFIDEAERAGFLTETTLGSVSTSRMADTILSDAQNATRLFNAFFGKLPYSRIAMTQQPAAFFGQAWPTLVFMPYTAFMDTTQRAQLFGARGGTDTFWEYVAPHEIAHQWWGHLVGWKSYHDQWMSEGFAEFSASLFVQFILKDMNRFVEFWENQRKRIVESSPMTNGRRPFTIGPVTQGLRLSSARTGAVYQNLVYPKGAYILHMLRMMMHDKRTRDARFTAMMKDFVRTHYNQDVSTEDFKQIVQKHMTKEMDIGGNGRIDWFFDQWVYGTEVPSYSFEYQIAPSGALSGRISQSGVSEEFVMLVPVYVDAGKGWIKIGSATLTGNSSVELSNIKLPTTPKRAAICAMNDVLSVSVKSGK